MTQPLTPAEIRLAQYGQRTSTWSTATYNDGTEKALHEIALGLKAEVDRLRAALVDQANADTVANRAAQVITSTGAEIRALKQERNRYRNAWHNARARAADARGDVEFTEAAAVSAAARPRATGQREDDGTPRHEVWSPHCEDGCCR